MAGMSDKTKKTGLLFCCKISPVVEPQVEMKVRLQGGVV